MGRHWDYGLTGGRVGPMHPNYDQSHHAWVETVAIALVQKPRILSVAYYRALVDQVDRYVCDPLKGVWVGHQCEHDLAHERVDETLPKHDRARLAFVEMAASAATHLLIQSQSQSRAANAQMIVGPEEGQPCC